MGAQITQRKGQISENEGEKAEGMTGGGERGSLRGCV